MFQTILTPVDFSQCSLLWAEKVVALGKAHGARIVLLHVFDVPAGLSPDTLVHPVSTSDDVSISELLSKEAQEYMKQYLKMMEEAGLEASSRLVFGPVPERILEVAKDEGADLIVMGTHGRKGLARLMLGSVTEQVLRRADIPVLTFRTQHLPSCEASSCATCTSGITLAEQHLQAELDG